MKTMDKIRLAMFAFYMYRMFTSDDGKEKLDMIRKTLKENV